MKKVMIGDLRWRLVLEAVARVDDGGGGASESWTEIATLWAAVRPLRADENVVGDVIDGNVTHEIWIRYRSGVVPAMRFRQDSRIFEILGVVDMHERRRWLKLLCEERRL